MSDTALWAASFRAREEQRAHAAFKDPLASGLAGERGHAIARSISRAAMVEWGIVTRTSAIDRLIHQALTAGGVDTVLNLGAGLDTRPYRMKLPTSLHWIELDFPNIVDLKNSKLAGYRPVCRLERIGIDLLDRSYRNEIFTRCGATSKSTLAITEGVLSYLSVRDAAGLAGDLHAIPAMRFWIQDFDNAGKRSLPRGWAKKLENAPFLFEAKDWFDFFLKYGWEPSHVITSFEESRRINRPYPLDIPFGLIMRAIPKSMSQKIMSTTGAVLMQRIAQKSDRAQSRCIR